MTFLELCQAVVTEVGLSGQISSVLNQRGDFSRVVSFVRSATSQLEGRRINWRFLYGTHTFETSEGIATYIAPEGLNIRQWDHENAFLNNLRICTYFADDMINYERAPEQEIFRGRPNRLIVERNNDLRFIGIPDDTYQISIGYYRAATVLTNDQDTPRIPVQFQRIIIADAIRRYANYDEAPELKQQALEEIYGVGGSWVNPEAGSWLQQLEADQLPNTFAFGATQGGQIVVRAE